MVSSHIHALSLQFPLPLMHQKKDDSRNLEELETQNYIEYWIIEDMFTFENIGFSNSVGDYKYLICADCEMGPIGKCMKNSLATPLTLQFRQATMSSPPRRATSHCNESNTKHNIFIK